MSGFFIWSDVEEIKMKPIYSTDLVLLNLVQVPKYSFGVYLVVFLVFVLFKF